MKRLAHKPLPNDDDHARWCACGLPIAGSTRQIVAMAAVHWRTCDTWRLLDHNPRKGH